MYTQKDRYCSIYIYIERQMKHEVKDVDISQEYDG